MKIDPATVEIKSFPEKSKLGGYNIFPGRKIILVAGEPYAEVRMDSHGPRGNSFWFMQCGGETVCEPGNARGRTITVRGDKFEQDSLDYNRKGNMPYVRAEPVAKRLHAKAVELVEAGLIVSAKVQAERVAARRQAMNEAGEKRAAEKLAKWRKRVVEVIGDESESKIAGVIELMEWAQSQ